MSNENGYRPGGTMNGNTAESYDIGDLPASVFLPTDKNRDFSETEKLSNILKQNPNFGKPPTQAEIYQDNYTEAQRIGEQGRVNKQQRELNRQKLERQKREKQAKRHQLFKRIRAFFLAGTLLAGGGYGVSQIDSGRTPPNPDQEPSQVAPAPEETSRVEDHPLWQQIEFPTDEQLNQELELTTSSINEEEVENEVAAIEEPDINEPLTAEGLPQTRQVFDTEATPARIIDPNQTETEVGNEQANYQAAVDLMTQEIIKNEKLALTGYVPSTVREGIVEVNPDSGVTIAAGFDLAHNSRQTVENWFGTELAAKFEPYYGLKGWSAYSQLEAQPLSISQAQAEQIARGTAQMHFDRLLTSQEHKGTDLLQVANPKIEAAAAQIVSWVGPSNFDTEKYHQSDYFLHPLLAQYQQAFDQQDWRAATSTLNTIIYEFDHNSTHQMAAGFANRYRKILALMAEGAVEQNPAEKDFYQDLLNSANLAKVGSSTEQVLG